MKKLGHYFIAWLLCGMLASCGADRDGPAPGDVAATVEVAFILHLDHREADGSQQVMRGAPSETAAGRLGTDFDTWIKKGTLKIEIYEAQGAEMKYVGKVDHLVYFPDLPSATGTTYRFQGRSSVALTVGSTYRFMVVANCDTAAPRTSGGPLFDLSDIAYGEGGIPLWGVAAHTVDHRKVQQLPPVRMMRAVAKVEVRLSANLQSAGYRLSQVRLSPFLPQGYAYPCAWQKVDFTDELQKVEDSFHPVDLLPPPSPPLYFLPSPEGAGSYLLYLPEYGNEAGREAKISLTVSKDDLEEDYEEAIEFKNYENGIAKAGTDYPLVRNRSYQFVIKAIEFGHPLWLESQVLRWQIEEETWDYTDHISVRSEGKMQWAEGTYQHIEQETGTVVMRPGLPMVCHFQIDTPVDARWHASFIPVSGAKDAFRFETFALNDGMNAGGKVGEPVELKIRSVQSATPQNNVARLRVVVMTKGGRTILVKNLLPDEFQSVSEYTIVQPK